jgi:hypothetical protein
MMLLLLLQRMKPISLSIRNPFFLPLFFPFVFLSSILKWCQLWSPFLCPIRRTYFHFWVLFYFFLNFCICIYYFWTKPRFSSHILYIINSVLKLLIF